MINRNYYPLFMGNPYSTLPPQNVPQQFKEKYCGYESLNSQPYLRPMPMAVSPKAEYVKSRTDNAFSRFLRRCFG